jgi:phage gp36-like protein
VQFVVVDMDKPRSAAQEDLVKRFYKGYIPQVVVLNREGKIDYNASGEVDEWDITKVFEKALK